MTRPTLSLAASRFSSLWTASDGERRGKPRLAARPNASRFRNRSLVSRANDTSSVEHPIRQLVSATRALLCAEALGLNGDRFVDVQETYGWAHTIVAYRYGGLRPIAGGRA